MTMRTFRHILLLTPDALPGTTVSTTAQAEQMVQDAQHPNSGCTCGISNLTVDQIMASLPAKSVPKGAEDMKIVRAPDGKYQCTIMAPADLDLLYGGRGDCPQTVFGEVAPEDGLRQLTAGTTDTSACPKMRGQALHQVLGTIACQPRLQTGPAQCRALEWQK